MIWGAREMVVAMGLGRLRLEGFPAIQPTAYPQRLERLERLFGGWGGGQPSLDVQK